MCRTIQRRWCAVEHSFAFADLRRILLRASSFDVTVLFGVAEEPSFVSYGTNDGPFYAHVSGESSAAVQGNIQQYDRQNIKKTGMDKRTRSGEVDTRMTMTILLDEHRGYHPDTIRSQPEGG
ncbi:unnamed protein product [Ectocarpus sp. CCAP 1310/34]|nr:unnamed protein product [Ectocarpus sp. CCAP 1310/34]